VANLLAALRLVADILTSNKLFAHNPVGLLAAGGVIWVNERDRIRAVVLDLDRGGARFPGTPAGPETRRSSSRRCSTRGT